MDTPVGVVQGETRVVLRLGRKFWAAPPSSPGLVQLMKPPPTPKAVYRTSQNAQLLSKEPKYAFWLLFVTPVSLK